MRQSSLMLLVACALTACGGLLDNNAVPREKVATYDPATRSLTLPHPCPDWSASPVSNYKNTPHSNFGCAVNTNLAVQVEEPADLHHGHGEKSPDTGITTGIVEQYREGKIPLALEPVQASTAE